MTAFGPLLRIRSARMRSDRGNTGPGTEMVRSTQLTDNRHTTSHSINLSVMARPYTRANDA